MANKKEKKDDLDTETTFVDMNVEGFRWYDPSKKKNGNKNGKIKLTRKEYWSMVKGAFAAIMPMLITMIFVFGIIVCVAYLWLS